MTLIAAVTRFDVANYVQDLFDVYIAFLLIYILTNLVFSFGLRPPYSPTLDTVLKFLRDVSEPYLRIFRRLIPSFGGIDLSPMLALIVLGIVSRILVNLISGN
jgi:YggT family protein